MKRFRDADNEGNMEERKKIKFPFISKNKYEPLASLDAILRTVPEPYLFPEVSDYEQLLQDSKVLNLSKTDFSLLSHRDEGNDNFNYETVVFRSGNQDEGGFGGVHGTRRGRAAGIFIFPYSPWKGYAQTPTEVSKGSYAKYIFNINIYPSIFKRVVLRRGFLHFH